MIDNFQETQETSMSHAHKLSAQLIFAFMLLLGSSVALAGWTPGSEKPDDQGVADADVAKTIAAFKTKDPGLKRFFDTAAGYAVFPTVGKGGIGIGGAYGEGKVYRSGKYIGETSLSQLTIGLQLGGQAYSEVIFFGSKAALNDFTDGNFEFSAQASAVAVTAGASADADYDGGIAVFTMAKGGLMYEASVGGQKFSFTPAK
jgi:lipid-binding SYLF domain-containing protein